MSWDPDVYLQFAHERTRPAVELLARIPLRAPSRVIDLGCGPGNSTALLASRWPKAEIEGLESSPEMLAKARSSGLCAQWIEGDVQSWSPDGRYDVIYSNAALHWLPDHREVLPRLMGYLGDRGTLAFQMPRNFAAPSHMLMREVANTGPWAKKLANVRRANVLEPADYFDILAPLASSLDVWETTYLHVLEKDDAVLAWVRGTGLRPFLAPLEVEEQKAFISQYGALLREAYPRRTDGKTLFPFQRLFVVAMR